MCESVWLHLVDSELPVGVGHDDAVVLGSHIALGVGHGVILGLGRLGLSVSW